MPTDFHFLSPHWFLALLPLAAILLIARRRRGAADAWERVVDRQLLPYLLVEPSGAARWLPLTLVSVGWLIAVAALANPTFERRPAPAVRPSDARVVVLDLSASMEASDLKPTRLMRARYKVADILNRSRDGQVGLVAFAGDAFVVAPLSDDANTLLAMLEALSPEVMPVRGSRPDLALAKAGELLSQGGARGGEVILIGDDAGDERARAAARALAAEGRTLSVIGVGTVEGAPVPGARDADGKPAMARLDAADLRDLARAGGGDYATLTPDAADLDLVLHRQPGPVTPRGEDARTDADQWYGLGPWLTLALLPLGALAFRRGWLLGAALTLVLVQGSLSPRPALALSWADLWQRSDQQAAAALARGDHQGALELAEQPDQRGTASYRLGDYQGAAEDFGAVGGADGPYNRGNALALAGKLEESIAAYDEALRQEPGMADALYNKGRVEELLKQQQEQRDKQQDRQQNKQQTSGSGDGSNDQSGGGAKEGEPQAGAGSEPSQGEPGESATGPQAGDAQAMAEQGQGGQPRDEAGARPDGSEPPQTPSQGQQAQAAQQGSGQGSGQGPNQTAEPSPAESAGRDGTESQQARSGGLPAGDGDLPEAKDAEARRSRAEKAAEDYGAEAARQSGPQAGQGQTRAEPPGRPAQADLPPEGQEARQAAEQWLRRIPDDPSGLLRRKFLYQYRQRSGQGEVTTSGKPW
jgi:Ca-activated chloride channel homolog